MGAASRLTESGTSHGLFTTLDFVMALIALIALIALTYLERATGRKVSAYEGNRRLCCKNSQRNAMGKEAARSCWAEAATPNRAAMKVT